MGEGFTNMFNLVTQIQQKAALFEILPEFRKCDHMLRLHKQ